MDHPGVRNLRPQSYHLVSFYNSSIQALLVRKYNVNANFVVKDVGLEMLNVRLAGTVVTDSDKRFQCLTTMHVRLFRRLRLLPI